MTLINDDCLHYLSSVEDNTYDLIVTDPPYGIAFMGKDWDKALPDPQVWKECFRVLKEGKMAFVMCSPRQDVLSRMIISLEDAGFRTNYTSIYWTYASGFPKAKNNKDGSYVGFQPKPAVEVILVVSKGKSLTWLDDCRIPHNEPLKLTNRNERETETWKEGSGFHNEVNNIASASSKGRFPANLLVSDDVLNDGRILKSSPLGFKGEVFPPSKGWNDHHMVRVPNIYNDSGSYSRYFDLDKWYSFHLNSINKNSRFIGIKDDSVIPQEHNSPQSELKTYPFIITPKASKSERNKGCSEIDNKHPTVKPLKLMSYLITMGSREGDTILDPFVGSGTTYIAALTLNRKAIGIELNPEYFQIAQARIVPYLQQTKLFHNS